MPSSIYSNDSDALVTPTSEFESPFSHKRTSSNDAQEVRHPRFPDFTGRRGSAAGQHDLVIQAQKGLGPTIRNGQRFNPGPKATTQFDLQTQSRYGLGPTVSLSEPPVERRGSSVQHDLLSQAVYGHGPTVPISQPLAESRKSDTQYDLATQAPHVHGERINLRNPYGNKKNYESYDLSSQYRKFL